MRYIKSIFDIMNDYDCIFCDINGVLTDGMFLFYGVRETLEHLYSKGKHIVLVSNATRTKEMVKSQLQMLGIDDKFLNMIVTSGDVLRHRINCQCGEFSDVANKNKFFIIGNKNFLEGISGISVVDNINEADFVMLNGIVSDIKINDHSFFRNLLKRKTPFICTNPDKIALNGDSFFRTPGYAAAKYRRLGGIVHSYGKPSSSIYDRVFELYPGLKSLRILCIGDTLMTDIKGASDYGLDSVFITSGIAKKLRKGKSTVSSFLADHGIIPTYYTECFS